MLLWDGKSVERGLKTQRLKTSWQTSWTFRLLMSRESGRDAPRDGKNMFSTSDGVTEIEEVMRGRRVRKLFITLSFRANSRESRRDATEWSERRDETRRPSCVIFHDAIDDNTIRGSGRRCRRNFSFVRKFHRAAFYARTSEFSSNEKRNIKFKIVEFNYYGKISNIFI